MITEPPDSASAGGEPVTEDVQAEVRTFVIADVRGYTRFTQEHGDEAAARLARRFALSVSQEVEAGGGRLLELRGDEALSVFESPRQALRTAVALQRRFEQETHADPATPLGVGIGIDAGEAVAVQGGYRGGALNLAARLCALAAAGEILASEGVVHLARTVPAIAYRERRPVRLKGLSAPVRLVEVVAEGAERERAAASPPPPPRRTRRGRMVVAALAVAVTGAVAAVVLLVPGRSQGGLARIAFSGVGAVDPQSGRILSEVVPSTAADHLATAGDVVWTSNQADDTVSQIDRSAATVVRTIPVGSSPSGLAVGGGAVWVADTLDGTVSRIDPQASRVVQTIRVGHTPTAVAFGAGAVWVANAGDRTLSAIDPRSGRVRRTIAANADGRGLVAAAASLWDLDQSTDSVVQLDLRSGRVVRVIRVGAGPSGVASAFGAIWVANAFDGTVSRIDPRRGIVTGTVDVGGSPVGVAAAGGRLWVADGSTATLEAVDPSTDAVTTKVPVGSAPLAIAAGAKTLWLSVGASPASHRGGTLRMVLPLGSLDSLDPALANSVAALSVLLSTNDGLVTFRRSGGSDGTQLVPDLATSLPAPQDGGRTYTFELRRGVRYSTGDDVSAADFRFALERDFALHSPGARFYAGIVGGAACAARPARCDLSRGVVADAGSRTVTFHLTAPDPDFLDKLALPFADALPPGTTPPHPADGALAATGPYTISRYRPHRSFVLVRNPRFRLWSAAAQPQGYPDRIAGNTALPLDASTTAVEHGRADLLLGLGPSPNRLGEVDHLYASQVHSHPYPAELYVFLNMHLAPFDDVRVRRALNYALDRNRIVALVGGRQAAQPTCQVLPPLLPGYRAYCPYTRAANAGGSWSAPDLERARRLVAASSTRGMRVVLWSLAVQPYRSVMDYAAGVLRRLGYRASVRLPGDATYFQTVSDSRTRAQGGLFAWIADYPAPSDFLQQLRCGSFSPANPGNPNTAEFCDRRADALMRRAAALEQSDPQTAARAWARVDRRVVDQAAYAPLYVPRSVDFVSRRVGGYSFSPQAGVLVDQLWVR